MLTWQVLFRFFRGASESAAPTRIGPLTSQAFFRTNRTDGVFGSDQTIGLFKEPKDGGRFS